MKNLMKFLLAIMAVGTLASCGTDIDAGSEGFMFYKYGDGVESETVYEEGFEFHTPWNDLIVYDMREQSRSYESSVLDKNGLTVTVSVKVNSAIIKGQSPYIHLKYGTGYQEVLVDVVGRGAIKDVVGKYSAEELYSTKRDALETEIQTSIENELAVENIRVSLVEVIDVGLPKSISQAIENKEKQEQANLFAAKKEQEQINLAKAKRAKADGDAYAIEKVATAEANAIKRKQDALRQSPQYVELVKAETWNGVLPTYMSNGGNGSSVWLDLRDKN